MVKGISKQVVLVKPQGETAFEQAIFIVKDGAAGVTEQELLRQAGIAAAEDSVQPKGRSLLSSAVTFLSGAGLVGLSWLLSVVF